MFVGGDGAVLWLISVVMLLAFLSVILHLQNYAPKKEEVRERGRDN